MTVYELIRELSEYGADQKVIFDVFIPGHEVRIDLGERKVTGEISASTDLDLQCLMSKRYLSARLKIMVWRYILLCRIRRG